tara:strand:- start:296 stop:706 length:411 start_codon:yes stop_codon:yes gene_type:complete
MKRNYINNIKKITFNKNVDSRGVLTSIEQKSDIPISIKRIFYMTEINSGRGGHAHIDTDQVIVCLKGSFEIKIFDGEKFFEKKMNSAYEGLYIPRMLFVDMINFSNDCVCLVLANTKYDMKKSIRDIDEYNYLLNS